MANTATSFLNSIIRDWIYKVPNVAAVVTPHVGVAPEENLGEHTARMPGPKNPLDFAKNVTKK